MLSDRTVVAILLFVLVAASFSYFLPSGKATDDIQILSRTGYIDSSGYFNVVGEVENIGSQAVTSVVVNVTFYDSSNVSITSRSDFTMLSVILAGRKSPFDIQLLNTAQSARVHNYGITFTYVHTISLLEELEILNSTSYTDDTGLHVTGQIKNIGDAAAVTVELVVTYFDRTGNVIAAVLQLTDSENPNLASGQTALFDVLLEDTTRVPLVASYEITAESAQYATIPEFPIGACLPLIMVPIEIAMVVRLIKKRTITKRLPPTAKCLLQEKSGQTRIEHYSRKAFSRE